MQARIDDQKALNRIKLGVFWSWMFNASNVQFHSKSFIQRYPSITLWRNNVFHSLSKNYFPDLQSFCWLG